MSKILKISPHFNNEILVSNDVQTSLPANFDQVTATGFGMVIGSASSGSTGPFVCSATGLAVVNQQGVIFGNTSTGDSRIVSSFTNLGSTGCSFYVSRVLTNTYATGSLISQANVTDGALFSQQRARADSRLIQFL